jgi:hypothetical protein
MNLNRLLAGLESEPGQASWISLATAIDVDQRRLKAMARVLGLGNINGEPRVENLADEIAGMIASRLSQR